MIITHNGDALDAFKPGGGMHGFGDESDAVHVGHQHSGFIQILRFNGCKPAIVGGECHGLKFFNPVILEKFKECYVSPPVILIWQDFVDPYKRGVRYIACQFNDLKKHYIG